MNKIATKIFPKNVNNNYTGHILGYLGFLGFIILTLIRSLIHIFAPDGGAGSIATIDLNIEGAEIIIGMFAFWGFAQLMFGLVLVIVALRYKNLTPLMFVFLIFEYVGRYLLTLYKPFETMETAPGAIGNYVLPFVGLIFLILSLMDSKKA